MVFLGMLNHSPVAFLPLIGFLILGYLGLVLLSRGWSQYLVFIIITVVFAYIWLKKYTFLPEGMFIHAPYFALGLSYIFFRLLHLLIETAGGAQERVGFGAYLLYTLNFTTLISGPIQRYEEFAQSQFAREPLTLGPQVVASQLERIVVGFFKVNILAGLLLALQGGAFEQIRRSASPTEAMGACFLLAAVYPFFLYANFSGYIDIVIALARLMRLRLPENFDLPFAAPSFIEFWNRWHITLSTWLKTYVFNPLLIALMRRISNPDIQPFLGVFCFFVTFFLVGIWHGRTSEFAVFGALQGGGVAINKLWQVFLSRRLGNARYKKFTKQPISIAVGRGLTFTWFAFTLFWFWADWKQINSIFSALSVAEWCAVWLTLWLSATVIFEAFERLRAAVLSVNTSEGPMITSRYARVVRASALAFISLVAVLVLDQPAPVIVYKTF
jgi:D-alanyl-lipoteichoic acid acyltransferase DltB (MBOAT superfamily)